MEVQVLDNGFVRLDEHAGGDLSVVNGARVSFKRRKEQMDSSDEELIKFLMEGRHGTPFEHNMFRFHVKAPIFVAREWFRHRIGSFNEWSLRYAKIENPDFYVPSEFRTQEGKPGEYTFTEYKGDTKSVQAALIRHNQDGVDLYNWMINRGIAREQARIVLPLGMFTEFYWTVNARSLMNFLSLRNSQHAQREIREYAMVIEEMFADSMPVTARAFVGNGRVAP